MEDDRYWVVRYFRRHPGDDPSNCAPGQEFLRHCPSSVRSKFFAVLLAVAKAPPHKFAGGGYWEAMHGDMAGYHEVRLDGPGREHFRLFCILDEAPAGFEEPALVVLCGFSKPFKTKASAAEYAWVRELGEEYRSRTPRSLT